MKYGPNQLRKLIGVAPEVLAWQEGLVVGPGG
jgi:hypothetical protein